MDEMCMTLGGRAAEEIVFGKISTGALSDLERITKMAYSMVSVYGLNDKIGNVSFYDSKQSDYNFQKPYSESTAQIIDEEVKMIIDEAYQRTKKLLQGKKKELEILAKELLEKEMLYQSDLEKLIGKRPFDTKTTYEEYTTPDAEVVDDVIESDSDSEDKTEDSKTSSNNGTETDSEKENQEEEESENKTD